MASDEFLMSIDIHYSLLDRIRILFGKPARVEVRSRSWPPEKHHSDVLLDEALWKVASEARTEPIFRRKRGLLAHPGEEVAEQVDARGCLSP